MAKKSLWADKVFALVRGGNTDAALAQMRVAPDPRDLQRLGTLLMKSGDDYTTVPIDYHEGLRYPRLERIEGTPDRLSEIFAAK